MEFSVGQIVKAKAGRDKDQFFIIKELEGRFAYIVNGKSRKVDKPKKKKLIHLAPTLNVVQEFKTNREVIRILSEINDKSL